jgi:hypothetical protein
MFLNKDLKLITQFYITKLNQSKGSFRTQTIVLPDMVQIEHKE